MKNNLFFLSSFFKIHFADTRWNLEVPQEEMERIYHEIKTPYKYGVVFQHPDSTKMVDSPTIFRKIIIGI